MLSAFIKEYALSCNFDKEYISDLMDANEDKEFTLYLLMKF